MAQAAETLRADREAAAPPALSRLSFGIVSSCQFILAMGNIGLVSVLPAIGRSIGIPDAFIAATFSLSGLLLATCSPMWARVSDRRGRKRLILLGVLGFTVSMVVCGLVITAGLHHVAKWWVIVPCLLAARGIFGAVGSAIGPSGQAYIAERVPRLERTKAIAGIAGSQGLGMVIGPLLAPLFILPVLGLAGPLFVFALIGATMLGLVAVFLKEGPVPDYDGEDLQLTEAERAGKFPHPWRDPRILPFLIYALAIGLAQGSMSSIFAFLVIDTVHATPAAAQKYVSIGMMCGAISGLVAQWGLIRLFNMRPRDLMRWGAALALLGFLMIIVSRAYWPIVAGYALASLGFAFARPGFTAGMSLAVTLREQARVAGILAVFAGLNVVTPLFVLLYQLNNRLPFLVHAVTLSAVFVYALRQPLLRLSGMTVTRREPAA